MRPILGAVLLLACSTSFGQSVYKCGSTFSQTPCAADAKLIAGRAPEPRRSASPELVEQNKASCRQAVLGLLKDPESARAGEVMRTGLVQRLPNPSTGAVVEGPTYIVLVNAKNGFGGYVGEKTFACMFSADERALAFATGLG